MDKKLFADLKQSLREAAKHARVERKDLRATVLPRPPQKMESAEIVALRNRINVSQAVFARYLNVSVKTVQSWEQSIGQPSGAALKLLSIARKNPQILVEV